MRGLAWWIVAGAFMAAAAPRAAVQAEPVASLMARVGAKVEEFYARARTVTSRETVRLQPLEYDFRTAGPMRELVYERRVAWEPPVDGAPASDASVLRHLLTVNGRPPRPKDEPQCLDPKDVSEDALAMLLPQNRGDYEFKLAGDARVDDRAALTIDFKNVSNEKPETNWDEKGTCMQVSLPGRIRGRLWVDAATYEVLRLDEHLIGLFDVPVPRKFARFGTPVSFVLERHDQSTRFREVRFSDPDETVMLPRLIETTTIWRNANRTRMTQTFSDYRRFVTDARIVVGEDLR
jgi:hypothetical protein